MSLSLDDLAVEELPCPLCGVEAGQVCVTRRTRVTATYAHASRTRLVYAAWREGFREGRAVEQRRVVQALAARRGGYHSAREVPLVGLDTLVWLWRGLDGDARDDAARYLSPEDRAELGVGS